jgi:hypothetical protein
MAMANLQIPPTYRYEHLFLRFSSCENISYLSFLVQHSRYPAATLSSSPLIIIRISVTFIGLLLSVTAFLQIASPLYSSLLVSHILSLISYHLISMIIMPKIDKAQASHRNSVSTASAAGGGTRSSSWSAKDDEILIQARAQGLNWNQISPKHFPQKSANACRKRHERLMERQNAEQWDGVKLDILAQAYMEVRREMWSILAARVGEKWTLVEQKVCETSSFPGSIQFTNSAQCMEKGIKNLTQAYRSSQRRQNDGTYHDHEDSGIGISDLEEESSPAEMLPSVSEAHFSAYPGGYPSQQPRVPSIQSMIHPPYHHPSQYMAHPHAHPHAHSHPHQQ